MMVGYSCKQLESKGFDEKASFKNLWRNIKFHDFGD